MPIKHPNLKLTRLTDALPAWTGEIVPADYMKSASRCVTAAADWWRCGAATQGNEQGIQLHVVLINETGMVCAECAVVGRTTGLSGYQPDIPGGQPHAARHLRPARHLRAGRPRSSQMAAPRAWPGEVHPLRKDFDAAASPTMSRTIIPSCGGTRACMRYPVGPVHAGIIEPDISVFPSSVRRVLRLEEHLGTCTKASKNVSRA